MSDSPPAHPRHNRNSSVHSNTTNTGSTPAGTRSTTTTTTTTTTGRASAGASPFIALSVTENTGVGVIDTDTYASHPSDLVGLEQVVVKTGGNHSVADYTSEDSDFQDRHHHPHRNNRINSEEQQLVMDEARTDHIPLALSVDGTGSINSLHDPIRRPSAVGALFCSNSSFTWLYLLILGVTCATLAFCIDWLVNIVLDGRVLITSSPYYVLNYMVWIAWGTAFGMMSYVAVQWISTDAIGSGIPEMKSILTGVVMLHYLSFRTLASKITGLIAAFGSGLSIGREGPYVHMASIVAQNLAKVPLFKHIRDNEALMAQMLNAGCAAGVSSTFGAPVGGVIFSMEVVSTYYMVNNIWKAFFASLSGAVVAYLYGTTGSFTLFSTSFEPLPYDPVELIAFSFLGVFMGLFGALFIKVCDSCFALQRRFEIFRKKRYTVMVAAAVVTGVITWPLPYLRANQHDAVNDLFSENKLQNNWQEPTVFLHLVIFIVLKFLMTAFSVTLPIPAGVFTPVFAIGAGAGRLVGEIMRAAFPSIDVVAGGYAVVGAAAMASGVTRTISTAVIVFELTGQLHHMLPVLLAVLLSVGVGNLVNDSFYDNLLKQKGLPVIGISSYIHHSSHKTSRDIMSRNMFYVSREESTFNDLKDLMRRCDDVAFPLVQSHGSMTLLGQLQRAVLQRVLQEREDHIMQDIEVPKAFKRARRRLDRRSTFQYVKDAMSPLFKTVSLGRASVGRLDTQAPGSAPHDDDHDGVEGELAGPEGQPMQLMTGNSASDDDIDDIDNHGFHPTGTGTGGSTPRTPSGKSQSQLEREYMIRRTEMLAEVIDWQSEYLKIDPAPFQLPERTPVRKVHFYFTMLGANRALITQYGKLVGVITKEDLVRFSKLR